MKNLKKRRTEMGYTGEALGQIVQVKKSAISKYESGEIQPSLDVLLRLSDTLECSTDYLLGRENELLSPLKTSQDLAVLFREIYDTITQEPCYINGVLIEENLKTIILLCLENCLNICRSLTKQ